MGVVYAAWDTELERRVALKMVHHHLLANPAVSKRFLQEARAAARIEHPNVVRIYGMLSIDGDLAIEMQYIDGTPLSALLRPVPLPAGQAVELLSQVLTALAACHAQGVIHCDLKPSNLLLDANSHLYLTDFGIARALQRSGGDQEGPTATTGTVWGTPRYTPPEAWHGEQPTVAWDLYALGLMVYEALVARPAFQANTPAALVVQILNATPEPLQRIRPELSDDFVKLIHDLMAQDPARRPPSASSALVRLQRTTEHQLARAETQPLPRAGDGVARSLYRPPRASRFIKHPLSALLVCALTIGIVVGISGWQGAHRNEPVGSNVTRHLKELSPEVTAAPPAGSESPRSSTAAVAGTTPLPEAIDLVASQGGVYFVYDDGVHGVELWFANLAGELRLLKDLVPGAASSGPQNLMARPGDPGIVFSADTPEFGRELWHARMHGYPNFEVRLIKDIIPGRMGSEPQAFYAFDNVYFFHATTLHDGRELWMTNTREQQTAMVTDLYPGVLGSTMISPRYVAASRGFYFLALKDGELGQQLFHYSHDTLKVRHIADVPEETHTMAVLRDSLFLNGADPDHGMEPWIFRPADPGIERLVDIYPGPISSDPHHLFSFTGRLYFTARTESTGHELWVSDGTPDGTVLLADVEPGPEGSDIHAFVDGGERLYFRATTAAHGNELWSSDGTAAGTRIVADVWPGPESGQPYNITPAGNSVFFTAKDLASGEELWMANFDQSGVVFRVADLAPGPDSAEPHNLTIVGTGMGMLAFKSPETGPALATLNWNVEPPVITVIELPHASKNGRPSDS
jgi:ELWxxDGT repeat protein